MFLSRIRVNDFRVLKQVDLDFEKNFPKRIFPLGSYNGGGKSTLLQLIFILLHCSIEKNRLNFLKDLLKSVSIPTREAHKELLYLEIFDEEQKLSFKITFSTCNSNFLIPLKEKINEYSHLVSFDIFSKLEVLTRVITPEEKKLKSIPSLLEILIDIENTENSEERFNEMQRFYRNLRKEDQLFSEIEEKYPTLLRDWVEFSMITKDVRYKYKEPSIFPIKKLLEELQNKNGLEFKKSKADYELLSYISHEISKFLEDSGFVFITSFNSNDKFDDIYCLLCKIESDKSILTIDDSKKLLEKLSNKVYLAAPSTQVFLFLDDNQKKILFQIPQDEFKNFKNYLSILESAKKKLKGLFTYDFLAVDYILKAFKKARDEDFKIAVTSPSSEYGNNYKTLLQEFNQLLEDKTLSLDPDITGVNFKLKVNGEQYEDLQPEDLSHGELKRLSIFMWIKYMNIQNSIVLMDEIEIAFHPDWQYLIVRDLEQWGKENQYILATHSYELCQAVTPKQVKDLPPFKKSIEKF